MQDTVNISEFRKVFNLSDDKITKKLLKISSSVGLKVIHDIDGEIHTSSEYFCCITEFYTDIHRALPVLSDIVDSSRDYIPFKKGYYVYFLISNGIIVYVGRTTTLAQRISTHTDDKEFDKVAYINTNSKDINLLESVAIREFTPKYNIYVMDWGDLFGDCIKGALSNH